MKGPRGVKRPNLTKMYRGCLGHIDKFSRLKWFIPYSGSIMGHRDCRVEMEVHIPLYSQRHSIVQRYMKRSVTLRIAPRVARMLLRADEFKVG
jgi:hypothetical protein